MMRSEAITIIKRGLGFRQTQDAAIIAALKQAQRDLEAGHTLPKWLLQVGTQVDYFTYNSGQFQLPTNFLRASDDFPPFYVPGELANTTVTKVFLPRREYLEAYNAYVGSGAPGEEVVTVSQSQYPEVWVQINRETGILFPRPTKNFKLYFTYYFEDQVLDTDIENFWLKLAPNLMIGVAGVYVAGDVRDKGAAERFSLMAKSAHASMFNEIIEAELVGRPLIMGRNN